MAALEDQISVQVSDELRALYRSFRAAGGVVSLEASPSARETPPPPATWPQGGARVERSSGPSGTVRLKRSGGRPLVFEGAVAMHVSTEELGVERGFWHELAVYVDDQGGVVGEIGLRLQGEGPAGAAEWSAAERIADPDAFEAFLAAYDPAQAFPALTCDGDLTALDRVAQAREDFVRLVSAFCGPTHPATTAAAARLNVRRHPQ